MSSGKGKKWCFYRSKFSVDMIFVLIPSFSNPEIQYFLWKGLEHFEVDPSSSYQDSVKYFMFVSIFELSIFVITFPWRGLGFTTHRWSCLWRLLPSFSRVQPGSPGQPAKAAARETPRRRFIAPC